MKRETYEKCAKRALEYYEKASIVLSEEEKGRIEVVDLGLDDIDNIGLEILTYINTERVCAKEMVLFPHQTCPEHMHVPTNGMPGKEETFRCRYGKVYLYVPGDGRKEDISVPLPKSDVSVFHEKHRRNRRFHRQKTRTRAKNRLKTIKEVSKNAC